MGLLLFLIIVGGLGALACFVEASKAAPPTPVLVKVTALDNAYERLETPKPKRSHKKKPASESPFRSF
jgi:hypothetical protein